MSKKVECIDRFELKKIKSDIVKERINTVLKSVTFSMKFYDDDIDVYESAFIILLNVRLETIGYAKISQGSLTGTVVDPRLICKYAVDSMAAAVILIHNHPSGSPEPSKRDMKLTENVFKALKLLDVKLVDHIVITSDVEKYYSFSQDGFLNDME